MTRKQTKDTATESDAKNIDFEFMGSREESAENRTIASRERFRDQLTDEVEEFLSKGGHIDQVKPHETGSPISKPSSNYGDRPI